MRNPIQIQSLPQQETAVPKLSVVKTYKKGAYIYHQGATASQLYKVNSGLIVMGCYNMEGDASFTHFVAPGEFFGEESLHGEYRQSFAMVLSSDAEITAYKGNKFARDAGQQRVLNGNYQQILKRIQGTVIRNTSLQLAERIKQTLLEIGRLVGVQLISGELLIRSKIKHRELALLCSASRQSVTTQLVELSNAGYFTIDRDSILLREKLINQR